jgi:hypothetical protein
VTRGALVLRLLDAGDAVAWQPLRLQGLAECPTAFASSVDEEAGVPLETVAARLAPAADRATFGAFEGALIGTVGLRREGLHKLAHKAWLWGMYVAPSHRRGGVGRALVAQALEHARRSMQVRQVNLGVNAANLAALRLYEAMGFERFGLERGFMCVGGVLQDEWHMACVLAPADDRS